MVLLASRGEIPLPDPVVVWGGWKPLVRKDLKVWPFHGNIRSCEVTPRGGRGTSENRKPPPPESEQSQLSGSSSLGLVIEAPAGDASD